MGQLVIYQEINESYHDLDCSELRSRFYTLKVKINYIVTEKWSPEPTLKNGALLKSLMSRKNK